MSHSSPGRQAEAKKPLSKHPTEVMSQLSDTVQAMEAEQTILNVSGRQAPVNNGVDGMSATVIMSPETNRN